MLSTCDDLRHSVDILVLLRDCTQNAFALLPFFLNVTYLRGKNVTFSHLL